ncbi:fimbrial biogenesis chaperone [Enterobacter ludwigii]
MSYKKKSINRKAVKSARGLRGLLVACAVLSVVMASGAVRAAPATGLRFYPMQLNYNEAENKGGIAMNVTNNTTQNYLLKGSVAAMDSDTGRFGPDDAPLPPFVILPPLARLEAGGKYSFRVRQVGDGLPKDRESACIVSVTAIPATNEPVVPLRPAPEKDAGERGAAPAGQTGAALPPAKDTGPQLQIALRMNMRLFWRPDSIPERDNTTVAGQLRFRAQGDGLLVENPTPYFVQLSDVTLNGRKVKPEAMQGYVRPKASRRFTPGVPVKGEVTWHFGGDKDIWRAATGR